MNISNLVALFAESGYLINPEALEELCQLPDEIINIILIRIKIKCPDTLVITVQTLTESLRKGIIIDHILLKRTLIYNSDFNFRLGLKNGTIGGLYV